MLALYATVALASTLKFIGGPLAGVALGLSWWETGLCSAAGMMFTVVSMVLFGDVVRAVAARLRKRPARLFSKRARFAVKVWRRTGIIGLAALTPVLFSPVGGAILAASFKPKKRRLFPAMAVSAVAWGLVISFVVHQLPGLFSSPDAPSAVPTADR